MAYYIDLFSPETYETFSKSKQDISGFRQRQEGAASRIQVGDKLICYMTKFGRWIGILEVTSPYFKDSSPLFYSSDDPYVIRFGVKPIVWLSKEKGIPIHEDKVWNRLSFTKNVEKGSSAWTGIIRSSLNSLDEDDGKFLEELITSQVNGNDVFEIDEREYSKHLKHKIRRPDGEVTVSIPQDTEREEVTPRLEVRSPSKSRLYWQKSVLKWG